jgi:hypothetical protein
MEMALTREELLALLDDIGGHGFVPEDADEATLTTITSNRLALVTNHAAIDRALTRHLPMTWRGRLIARKIELDNAARAVADAARGRPPQRGNLVVVVPPGIGISHFHGQEGRVVSARTQDGQTVLDLFAAEFRSLLSSRQHGLAWQAANPNLLAEIAQVAR